MTENFIFKAIFISLAAHTAILCMAYFGKMNAPQHKGVVENRVEISYHPMQHRPIDIHSYPIKPAQRLDLSNDERFLSDGTVPVSLVKDKPDLPFGMLFERKPEHMRNMELNHKISIMPMSSEKINNPVYAAYNQIVHDRIEERANANYDKMQAGTVFLTFVVDAQGNLEDARIVPEKTDAPEHLQEIALKSLKEASPFPPFLKGMNLTEYPFNIEIQYQVNDD